MFSCNFTKIKGEMQMSSLDYMQKEDKEKESDKNKEIFQENDCANARCSGRQL